MTTPKEQRVAKAILEGLTNAPGKTFMTVEFGPSTTPQEIMEFVAKAAIAAMEEEPEEPISIIEEMAKAIWQARSSGPPTFSDWETLRPSLQNQVTNEAKAALKILIKRGRENWMKETFRSENTFDSLIRRSLSLTDSEWEELSDGI